jgi:hypothetical protein
MLMKKGVFRLGELSVDAAASTDNSPKRNTPDEKKSNLVFFAFHAIII